VASLENSAACGRSLTIVVERKAGREIGLKNPIGQLCPFPLPLPAFKTARDFQLRKSLRTKCTLCALYRFSPPNFPLCVEELDGLKRARISEMELVHRG
jgi:hypothetical protein